MAGAVSALNPSADGTLFVQPTGRAAALESGGSRRRKRYRHFVQLGLILGILLALLPNRPWAQTTNDPDRQSFGNWTFHIVRRPLEGVAFAQIYTLATSVAVRDESAFAIRCKSNELYAVLFTNHHFRSSDRIQLRYRIDGKRSTTVPWRFDRSEAILMSPPGDYVSRFIASLEGSKTLNIRVLKDDGVLMSNRYSVAGFDRAIGRIRQLCPF